jgi:hypothetical protein
VKLYDEQDENKPSKAEQRLVYFVAITAIVVVVVQLAKAFGAWGD